MSYVVVPTFAVDHVNLDAFLQAARADATASVANEPGCQQFDVVVDDAVSPAQVMFYEVYADMAAFEHHLKTPHLQAFREALNLCDEGPVLKYHRVVP